MRKIRQKQGRAVEKGVDPWSAPNGVTITEKNEDEKEKALEIEQIYDGFADKGNPDDQLVDADFANSKASNKRHSRKNKKKEEPLVKDIAVGDDNATMNPWFGRERIDKVPQELPERIDAMKRLSLMKARAKGQMPDL